MSLQDIFKDDFLKKLKKLGQNIFPVTVVFMNEFEKDGKKMAQPIVFNHQNNNEVKERIMHIESPNTELLGSISKLLEKK